MKKTLVFNNKVLFESKNEFAKRGRVPDGWYNANVVSCRVPVVEWQEVICSFPLSPDVFNACLGSTYK